jgi:hypothetical protein
MARRKMGPTSRDLGIDGGGAGKGDADRTTDSAAYKANLAEINFPRDNTGFVKRGGRLVKTYSPAPPTIFGTVSKPVIH